jgi:MFS family permease
MAGLTHLTSTVAFIMILELTSSKHRGLVGNIAFLFFVFGEVLITLFAYTTRNWQNLLWANTIFVGVSLPCLYFIDESPLYLYSKKQYTRLERLLRGMAKANGRQDTDWFPSFQKLLSIQDPSIVTKKQLTFTQKFKQLVSHRTTIWRILITALIAFTETLLYYKISYGLAAMKISPYIGMLIGAAVEVVGYISATVLMSTRLGRKYSLIVLTGLTSACIFTTPFIIKHNTLSTVIISQIGKFAVSAANSVTWIYIAELFPTSIRSSTNGFAVAVSRLGAIAAPVIDSSVDEQYLSVTFYIYAALAFISVLLILPLPETKDKPLDDAIDITNSSDI